jgi:hypothetical protein
MISLIDEGLWGSRYKNTRKNYWIPIHMKYLKKFNESLEDIDSICKKYGIKNYTINSDGTVDVDGDVNLLLKNLSKLPL